MGNLKTTIKVLTAVTMLALPSQLLAGEQNPGNGPYTNLYSAIAPGQLAKNGGPFDQGTANKLKIVGASILVQGMSGGKLTVKEIEYTYGNFRSPRFGRPMSMNPNPNSQGNSAQFHPLPVPSACLGGSSEPILALGQEGNYNIRWCKNSNPSNPPNDTAKKNYYYMFANGDFQLVLTLEFECNLQSDRDLMPAAVLTGAC